MWEERQGRAVASENRDERPSGLQKNERAASTQLLVDFQFLREPAAFYVPILCTR